MENRIFSWWDKEYFSIILEKSKSEEENNSSNYYVIDIDYTVEFHAYFKEDIEKIMQELVTLVKSKLGSIKIKVNSNEWS